MSSPFSSRPSFEVSSSEVRTEQYSSFSTAFALINLEREPIFPGNQNTIGREK
jgi:hypothetical protein